MRKILVVLFGTCFLLLSCRTVGANASRVAGVEGNSDVISKLAPWVDFFSWRKGEEPVYSDDMQSVDIRSMDCSRKDISKFKSEDVTFDSITVFPTDRSKLPSGFNKDSIMETYKNPGLNLRSLHKQGIDGTGVSMAIIDAPLSSHIEYNDNLASYEEFLYYKDQEGSMHGAAVSSIAVGKSVGVAPKARLYYFAADLTDDKFKEDETKERTSKFYAQALDRILQINKTLPDNQKIVVVSVSAAPGWSRDPELWNQALDRAKKAGIFVTTTQINTEYELYDNGLYRSIYLDPESFDSYSQAGWQRDYNPPEEDQKKTLCFPMDHRTTAAPNGLKEYVHYASGGWSWMKPFEAGMYVLAKQVSPSVTPEKFFKVGLQTGYYSQKAKCVIVDPVKLIEKLRQ